MTNKDKNLNFNFNLSSAERVELERIVLDKDLDSAFNFVKRQNLNINKAEALKYCSEWLKEIKKAEDEKLKIRFSNIGPSFRI